MQAEPVPLPALIDSGLRLSWRQAVAVVQGIAAVSSGRSSGRSTESFAEFALDRDGLVVAVSDDDPVLSVTQLALLLGSLLPGETVPVRDRAPAGVQFAIARALGLVPAPSFATVEEFSRLLARFESADRSRLLRGVFDEYTAHASGARAPQMEGRASASSPQATSDSRAAADNLTLLEDRPPVERRRSRIPPDIARRLLREADQERYDAQARDLQARDRVRNPPPDMLRRFLREADRAQFEASRQARGAKGAGAPGARALNRWGIAASTAATAVLALLIAIAGIANHYSHASLMKAISALRDTQGRPPARSALPGEAGTELKAARVEQAGAPSAASSTGVGTPLTPAPAADGPSGAAPTTGHGVTAPRPHSAGAPARRPGPPSSARPPSSALPSLSAPARTANESASAADAAQPRRSAPVRFLSAVKRKLLGLVHRQASASRRQSLGAPETP